MFEELISGARIGSVGPVQVVISLLVSLVLALMTAFVYRLTHSGYAYSRSYNITMVSVAMVITLMMTVIGNYLALSLGLIGALSVIRFRTAIKDPKDIAYLFICIAIGLACSTRDYMIAGVGALVINATLLALHYLRFGAVMTSDYVLTYSIEGPQADAEQFVTKAREAFSKISFRSYCKLSDAESQYVYSLKLGKLSEEQAIAFLEKELPQIRNVSLIAPEANVEL